LLAWTNISGLECAMNSVESRVPPFLPFCEARWASFAGGPNLSQGSKFGCYATGLSSTELEAVRLQCRLATLRDPFWEHL